MHVWFWVEVCYLSGIVFYGTLGDLSVFFFMSISAFIHFVCMLYSHFNAKYAKSYLDGILFDRQHKWIWHFIILNGANTHEICILASQIHIYLVGKWKKKISSVVLCCVVFFCLIHSAQNSIRLNSFIRYSLEQWRQNISLTWQKSSFKYFFGLDRLLSLSLSLSSSSDNAMLNIYAFQARHIQLLIEWLQYAWFIWYIA